jgi:vibriolysin
MKHMYGLAALSLGCFAALGASAAPPISWVVVNYTENTSAGDSHPYATLAAPSGGKLVGGGARVNFNGAGNLLVETIPFAAPDTSNTGYWYAAARDHEVADPASTITVYGVVLPDPSNLYYVRMFSQQGAIAAHPSASVSLPAGYVMTGGGCVVTLPANAAGNLLTGSYPAQSRYQKLIGGTGPFDRWVCSAKDHDIASPASLTAYVVGVAPVNPSTTRMPVNCVSQATSTVAAHPVVQVAGNCLGAHGQLTGGGALARSTDPNGAGQLLTASFPVYQGPVKKWEARSKDHVTASPGTVTAYAVVVDFSP